MATVSTSIALNDNFSRVLNSIVDAVNQSLTVMDEMNRAMNSPVDTASIEGARNAISEAAASMQELENSTRSAVGEQRQFNGAVSDGVGFADALLGKVSGVLGAFAGAKGIEKIVDMSDNLVTAKSRLNMMNDGLQTTDELYTMIYNSAQAARGSLDGMTDVVARFGNNAKDAFSGNAEVVAFSELIQKQMAIAGASSDEASNAMLQLSQALGSGVLRGDELNSIFEQAPNLIQGIADYLNVPIGEIRKMASEGKLTADVVKASVFASADDINAKFNSMPKTWGQMWQSMQNQAVYALNPLLERVNELMNSEQFQAGLQAAMEAFVALANVALDALNVIAGAAAWVSQNWSTIAPIIMGIVGAFLIYKAVTLAVKVATAIATAVQSAYNAVMAANPVVVIIMALLVLIVAIYSVCESIAKFTGIANSGFGLICGGVMVVIGFFKNLGLAVANIALGIWEALEACGANIWAVFHNVFMDLKSMWYGFLKVVVDVVKGICDVLNAIPFINIDTSGLENASRNYANEQAAAQNSKRAYEDVGAAFNRGASTFDAFSDGWVEDAFNSGAAWGDGVVDGINSMLDGFNTGKDIENYANSLSAGNIGCDVGAIAENTGEIKDGLDITNEDLKYLRDLAEQETINRFTTAEITIEQTNHNNISSKMDLDGIVSGLTDAANEAVDMIAEGVHI